jgi:hypothetical protein
MRRYTHTSLQPVNTQLEEFVDCLVVSVFYCHTNASVRITCLLYLNIIVKLITQILINAKLKTGEVKKQSSEWENSIKEAKIRTAL